MNKFIAGLIAITVSFYLWAGINEVLINALKQAEKEYQQKQEEKEMREAAYLELFGYIPTEEEIELIQRVAMAEGGNTESIEGIVMELIVISNRCLLHDYPGYKFPNDITGVCYQKNQFQTVTENTIWKYEVNDKVKEAWEIFLYKNYPDDFKYTEYYDEIYAFTAGYYNKYFTHGPIVGRHYFGGLL